MMVFALDTGARRGEMLKLVWRDVDLEHGSITFRGKTTKSGKTRPVPISTQRLRDTLDWLQKDASSATKPETAHVFSTADCRPIRRFPRTAWVVAVLKAHGIEPEWKRDAGYPELAETSRNTFKRIGLHWHDLRGEYASRLAELNEPALHIQKLCGHASLKTTERYLRARDEALKATARKLERGKRFAPGSSSTAPRQKKPSKLRLVVNG